MSGVRIGELFDTRRAQPIRSTQAWREAIEAAPAYLAARPPDASLSHRFSSTESVLAIDGAFEEVTDRPVQPTIPTSRFDVAPGELLPLGLELHEITADSF